MLQETIHLEAGIRREHILRPGENVFDKSGGNDTQRNFAVDAAEGEVVNLMPERRYVRAFGRVNLNREHVVGVKVEVRRQFKGKRCVSSLVFAEANSIEPNRGSRHYPFEIDEDMPAARRGRKLEMTAIDRHEFVVLVVKAVPGQANVGVGNDHPLELGIVKVFHARIGDRGAAEPPVPVHRKHKPPTRHRQ